MYHTILRLTLLFIILLSCLQGTTQATDSSQHLTFLEAKHLEIVKQFHSAKGFIKKFIESGMMAEDVEWFVPGPKEILPFAGLWKGEEGIKEFNRLLTATMRYDKAEVKEYIVDGNQVAAIFWGSTQIRMEI